MGTWTTLLAPLTVWAVHFLVVWGASSIAPDRPVAAVTALIATVPAIAVLAWLTARIRTRPASDETARWIRSVGLLTCAIGMVSILWQAAPAVLG